MSNATIEGATASLEQVLQKQNRSLTTNGEWRRSQNRPKNSNYSHNHNVIVM